jgi:DNA-binding transcriptional regulator YiaG
MKSGSKYYPLYAHLQAQAEDEVTLSFDEIERLLETRLPESARAKRAWWSNRSQGAVQAQAWMAAGYHQVALELTAGQVTFRKPTAVYHVRREGDVIVGDGDLIKVLRHHMGLTQAELAALLGMRQQTISEWETGAYLPKRATSKYLTLIAEQAGFKYES